MEAPNVDLKIQFWLDEGVPYYKVVSDGKELIEDAKMGLNTSFGSLDSDMTLVGEPVESSGDSTWEAGSSGKSRSCPSAENLFAKPPQT